MKQAGIVRILCGLHELIEQVHGEVGIKTIHRRRVDVEFAHEFRADLRPLARKVFSKIKIVGAHRLDDGAIYFSGI